MKPDETRLPATFLEHGSENDFQQRIEDWFDQHGESYPWRETRDPYAILVSELMLQQTRIATVLGRNYYTDWLATFPNWQSLAAAEETDLLRAWEGLGYYNRARNLQKTARIVVDNYKNELPDDLEKILELPGIGRYTAGAVMSFAFDRSAPILDGNVIRVLSRIMGYAVPVDTTAAKTLLWQWAEELTPAGSARSYNSGIMELGQKICTKSSPACRICPVASYCSAKLRGNTDQIPCKSKKTIIEEKTENVGIALQGGSIFLCQESGSRRKGLWKLPDISTEKEDLIELFRFNYAITRFKISLRVFSIPEPLTSGLEKRIAGDWFPLVAGEEELPPLGSPYRKAIAIFLDRDEDLFHANS